MSLQAGSNQYRFTGKERDAETGLDDFGARYHLSSIGRFMTPDWSNPPMPVPYATFSDPQTMNLYAYTENNPATYADPDGHDLGFGGRFAIEFYLGADFMSVKWGGSKAPEVSQQPTSLQTISVTQVPRSSPAYGQGMEYGAYWDIYYQVLDQSKQPMKNSSMVPYELVTNSHGTFFSPTEKFKQDDMLKDSQIGGAFARDPSLSTPKETSSEGRFHDVPFDAPFNRPFVHEFKQTIKIEYQGKMYKVRTNDVKVDARKKNEPTITGVQ